MKSPKIYLAIDNCFASKRWTKPAEWIGVVRDLGLSYVEASADNECDPLYTTPDYIKDWLDDIKTAGEKTGVRVANLYSGHGTYTTLGLSHTDVRVRERMLRDWLMPMSRTASALDAGFGFYCHAFPDAVLQNSAEYSKTEEQLYDSLAILMRYVAECGSRITCIEQMYTPHQIPWTIETTQKLLREVYKRSGQFMYITIDTGHQSGQRKFVRPNSSRIREMIALYKSGERVNNLWFGPKTAYELFHKAYSSGHNTDHYVEAIESEMDKYPYLFSQYEDGDSFRWLERLGCYSPIIHLQQTDGTSSSHYPFTAEYNQKGIITADKVLHAIQKSYALKQETNMPPPCNEIYLTLEIFSGTSEMNTDIIKKLEESVEYWRRFLPKDGMYLDELCARI